MSSEYSSVRDLLTPLWVLCWWTQWFHREPCEDPPCSLCVFHQGCSNMPVHSRRGRPHVSDLNQVQSASWSPSHQHEHTQTHGETQGNRDRKKSETINFVRAKGCRVSFGECQGQLSRTSICPSIFCFVGQWYNQCCGGFNRCESKPLFQTDTRSSSSSSSSSTNRKLDVVWHHRIMLTEYPPQSKEVLYESTEFIHIIIHELSWWQNRSRHRKIWQKFWRKSKSINHLLIISLFSRHYLGNFLTVLKFTAVLCEFIGVDKSRISPWIILQGNQESCQR